MSTGLFWIAEIPECRISAIYCLNKLSAIRAKWEIFVYFQYYSFYQLSIVYVTNVKPGGSGLRDFQIAEDLRNRDPTVTEHRQQQMLDADELILEALGVVRLRPAAGSRWVSRCNRRPVDATMLGRASSAFSTRPCNICIGAPALSINVAPARQAVG